MIDYWINNGKLPELDYPGTGKSPKGSYSYEFKPTANVKAMNIEGGCGDGCRYPNVRIVYGGKNKKLDDLGLVLVLMLMPGFGKIQGSGPFAGSIVWGCITEKGITKPFKHATHSVFLSGAPWCAGVAGRRA
jgi:hypothetical protein